MTVPDRIQRHVGDLRLKSRLNFNMSKTTPAGRCDGLPLSHPDSFAQPPPKVNT
jgi:hypothetical protein